MLNIFSKLRNNKICPCSSVNQEKLVDKWKRWNSEDLFGSERWEFIKNGTLKLYADNPRPYGKIIDNDYPDHKEIPLNHIPGIEGCNFLWNYDDDEYSYGYASIYYLDKESHWGGENVYHGVQVRDPIRTMIYQMELQEERIKRKEKIEKDRINGNNDKSIEDLKNYLDRKKIKLITYQPEDTFPGSSEVEQVAVNHRSGGSNPSRGAINPVYSIYQNDVLFG